MTFKELRKYLFKHGPHAIQWTKSGIVELAQLEKNGAVRITNAITKKEYVLPKIYDDMNIRILNEYEYVMLGSLLPKGKK